MKCHADDATIRRLWGKNGARLKLIKTFVYPVIIEFSCRTSSIHGDLDLEICMDLRYFGGFFSKKSLLSSMVPKAICVLMVTLMEQPKLWRTAFGGAKKRSRSWQSVAPVLRIRGATTCGWLPGCQIVVSGWVFAYCSVKVL